MKSAPFIVLFQLKDTPEPCFQQLGRLAVGITALTLLAACTSPEPLDQLASAHALERGVIQSNNFTLTTLGKPLPKTVTSLRVYIGSDGQPWQGREPNGNPTGTQSLAAELMAQDPLPALYLGRPCYHAGVIAAPCNTELWTSGRYSETVIATMVSALNEIIERHQVERLTLVGYSGGGTIALLCAARLSVSLDILVITVAANLDTRRWSEFHKLLTLSSSLNPLDIVPSPAPFTQIHLVGRSDKVVPQSTIQHYLETHPDATVLYVDDFDHSCCWASHWRQILEKTNSQLRGPIPSPGGP